MHCVHGALLRRLCAALIVIHDEYDSRPYEPVTSFQQPKEVTKKGRSPTNFLLHIFIRLQCQSGERKHPCKALRLVQTSMSGHLTSRRKIWKIGVVKKPKAATASPKKVESRNSALRCLLMACGHYALRLWHPCLFSNRVPRLN